MTAPIAHGYPDFARYEAHSDKVFLERTTENIGALTSYGPYFVGDSPALGSALLAISQPIRAQYIYKDAEIGGNSMGTQSVECRVGDVFDGQLPNLGPWLEVSVDANAFPAQFLHGYWTAAIPFRNNAGNAANNSIFSDGGSIYPPGVTNVEGAVVWPGEAAFFCEVTAAGLYVDLVTVSYTGAVRILTRSTFGNGANSKLVYLPAAHLRVIVTNTTGAGIVAAYALTAGPGMR